MIRLLEGKLYIRSMIVNCLKTALSLRASSLWRCSFSNRSNMHRYGPRGIIRFLFLWTSWAKRPEVQNAWKEIADIHNLSMHELSNPDKVFGFADSIILSGDAYPLR